MFKNKIINLNNYKYNYLNMYRLTLDTETSGLPIKQGNVYADPKEVIFYNNSRLLQISWICTYGNTVKLKRNFLVKNHNTIITNTHIHGIDNKMTEEKGINIEDIFEALYSDLFDTKMIIGYNTIFDLNIIQSELYRLALDEEKAGWSGFAYRYLTIIGLIQKIEKFDVMIYGMLYLKQERYLKLIKLYEILFKENYENPHDAMNDVIATFKCFIKLIYEEKVIE